MGRAVGHFVATLAFIGLCLGVAIAAAAWSFITLIADSREES